MDGQGNRLGMYARYSGGPRVDRMAAVVAASCDSMDVVTVVDADAALGCGYYGSVNVLKAAVRLGLMRRTGLPKESSGKTYRTTYAATEDGFRWLSGYRRFDAARKASGSMPAPKERRRTLPRKRVSLAEARRRLTSSEADRIHRAMEGMRARLEARDAGRRAAEGLIGKQGSGKKAKTRKEGTD